MAAWNVTTPTTLLGDAFLYTEGGPEGEMTLRQASSTFNITSDVTWGDEEGNWTLETTNQTGISGSSLDFSTRQQVYAIMIPLIIAFCVLSGLVSIAVVCATPWVKRPMSPTVRLSISLAAANTVFSFSLAVAVIVNSYLPTVHNIRLGNCVMLSIEAVRMGSILVQILHLLVVALNHYIGTLRPLHYAATMTPFMLKIILIGLWVIPMVGMFVAFCSIPGQGFKSEACNNNYFYINGITFRIVWSALFFGPTVLIIMVYCHIFHLLKHRGLYLVSAEQRNQLRRNIKTVRTTALIVGTFVVGWGPAVIKFLLVCDECVVSPTSVTVTMSLVIGASVNIIYCLKVFTDTFIYAVQLRDVRKALQTMWGQLRGRVTGKPVGHMRNMSRISYTASTRISLNSPSLRRLRASLAQRPLGSGATCNSAAQGRGTSPSHQPPRLARSGSAAPPSPHYKPPFKFEVCVDDNNHQDEDDPRLSTLVEETKLDSILEDDSNRL
ncbi:melanocortin receptor 4-like [Procambarus clarkii]|uniref:melanocortin receptor 4-like n=1 Tax=Procambarus clarkii TaxID=6728 RepID=UPI003742FD44